MGVVLLIIDGLGDLPTVGGKTPLQAARKPNLDALARNGITGMLAPLGIGLVPGSDTSHLQLFGYPPEKYYCGRGPLEALGIGLRLRDGDVAFRANFATLKGTEIIDRRAGRIPTKSATMLAKAITSITIDGVEFIFKNSVEHRGVVVARGRGISPAVSDTDPHSKGRMNRCKPLDKSAEAARMANLVNKYSNIVRNILRNHKENVKLEKAGMLKANGLLLRGAGRYSRIESIKERFGISALCIAGGALYKGVARFVGMDVALVRGATATKDTNLSAKVQRALEELKRYDIVFIHIKACDSLGHDGDAQGKKKMIERIDKEVIKPLRKAKVPIIVTADHSTPCSRMAHSGHEVPILLYAEGERKDSVKKFDEISCTGGGLGHLHGRDVMPLLLNLIKKGKMYGS